MAFYDPAALRAAYQRGQDILAAHPDSADPFWFQTYGISRETFEAGNESLLIQIMSPEYTPYTPPLPQPPQPPPAAGSTNGTGPTSPYAPSTGPSGVPMTITPTMLLIGLGILYAFSRK
jgi:hypothetical protein